MNIAKDSNNIPIPITMSLASVPATGVTLGDIVVMFHDGDGLVQTMSEDAPVELQEIDADEFPGEYLLVNYPLELTAALGRVRIKWEAVPAVVDVGSAEFDVDASASYLRDLWLAGFGGKSEFDPEQSAEIIYDENGDPYKKLPLKNKDGGDVVITGQGPVTREAAQDP